VKLKGAHALKHIIQFAQATLACVVMVAMVFSIPMVLAAVPIRIDVSLSSWKDLLKDHRNPAGNLPYTAEAR
jgi:hypothetical protein